VSLLGANAIPWIVTALPAVLGRVPGDEDDEHPARSNPVASTIIKDFIDGVRFRPKRRIGLASSFRP
jgi:hypothetical protein